MLEPCVDEFYEVAADAYLRQRNAVECDGELIRTFHALAAAWPRLNRRSATTEPLSLRIWWHSQSRTKEDVAAEVGHGLRYVKKLANKGSELMIEELFTPRGWVIQAIPSDGIVYVMEPKTPDRRND